MGCLPEGIVIKPDGINEWDGCIYKEMERHTNVTVIVSECVNCGNVDISWERQENTDEDDCGFWRMDEKPMNNQMALGIVKGKPEIVVWHRCEDGVSRWVQGSRYIEVEKWMRIPDWED